MVPVIQPVTVLGQSGNRDRIRDEDFIETVIVITIVTTGFIFIRPVSTLFPIVTVNVAVIVTSVTIPGLSRGCPRAVTGSVTGTNITVIFNRKKISLAILEKKL